MFEVLSSGDWKQTDIKSTRFTTYCQIACRCVGLSIYEILFGPRTSSNIDLLGPVAEAPDDGFPLFKPDKNMQGPCLPSPAVLPNAGRELPH